jgi:hypothetical protein
VRLSRNVRAEIVTTSWLVVRLADVGHVSGEGQDETQFQCNFVHL